ncbi:Zn-dependent exopeptidase [Pisolithus marmoratus]|nr:Zn-dependent exopeptidase [Pisolithus marmoratus]
MILNLATPVALLAILHASEVRPNFPPCLADNFYGIFGQQSVFEISDFACLELLPNSVAKGSVVPLYLPENGPQQLFWIQESSIDNSLRTLEYGAEVANFVDWLVSDKRIAYPDGQTILFEGGKPAPVSLVYRTSNSGVVAAADQGLAHILSTRLPRFWRALPTASPVSYLPVPETAIERVRNILVSLRFDALVAGIVGTDAQGHPIPYERRRNIGIAAKWLKTQFEDAGAACSFMPFSEGFAPNIVCRYDAKTESFDTVLISGHYDSRGSFGLERAPGGNDDGSGTISILNIARRIRQTGITFRTNVELVVFAGEEQGLLGSKAYTKELRERGANIVLMIQADMLAYHVSDEPPQLGLAQFIGTPEVTQLVANISAIYSPELTSSCMDMNIRVSLVESPSMNRDTLQLTSSNVQVQVRLIHINPLSGLTMVLAVADPMYHNSWDLSDRPGYDLNQIRSICKVQFATLLHAAGFDLPEGVNLEDLEELD